MRSLLQLNNIHKAYGAQIILDDASVTISENQKIGVIGRNGCGKSTLCKIIAGYEEQDAGTIQKSPHLRLAYLEQHDPYRLDETVINFLMRYTEKEKWQCAKVADRFEMKNDILDAQLGALPGGFRTRVKLTAMLLRDPNLLILDEPTNYLDLKTLILLEEFLQDYRGGFLIVSHDREFLKKTCKETLEIENAVCSLYPSTIENYLLFKEEQARLKECHNKNVLAKKKQLQTFIDRFGAKASKASQAKSMMKRMEKLQTIETNHPLGNIHLKIPNVEKQNLTAFRCNDLAIGYPGHQVASRITMEFIQGSHIAILGDNGQGKTTFMRTIANDLIQTGGSYNWGHSLKVGYYAQHILSSLDSSIDAFTYLSNKAQNFVTRQEILNLAGNFLFKGDDVLKKISVLSGGEKARLCLAGLLLAKNDVLLLDEPTNHLDFETVEAMGRSLKHFNGTVFFISHDRTFVNMLSSAIVEVDNGSIIHYPGNYEDYVYSMETRVREEFKHDIPVKPKLREYSHKPIKSDYHLARHIKSQKAKLSSKLALVQERLDRHKKEYDEICNLFMTNSSAWSIDLNYRYEYLDKAIATDEDLWVELTEKIEKLEKN